MRMLQEQAQPQTIAPVAKGAMEAVVAMLQQAHLASLSLSHTHSLTRSLR